MKPPNLNIFSRIKNYRKLSQELQAVLSKNCEDVQKFQEIFNLTVDRVYQDIREFELENIEKAEANIYKLKRIFEKRYRRFFLYGDYIKWCLEKPFGYAGDFRIIDSIYQNQPTTVGFDRLWDNWVMQLGVSKSVRERKEDFKKIILDFIKENKGGNIRIMNLACGPAREIKELLDSAEAGVLTNTTFDCYDFEIKALNYARQLLNNPPKVKFLQKNAFRLALRKNIGDEIQSKYDVIYSTGLFDYLDEKVAIRLVSNLKKLLNKNGIMLISNMGEKYYNPSAVWMEWVGEWFLIYRTEEEFKKIFLAAGFSRKGLQMLPQRNKMMQYCLARQ